MTLNNANRTFVQRQRFLVTILFPLYLCVVIQYWRDEQMIYADDRFRDLQRTFEVRDGLVVATAFCFERTEITQRHRHIEVLGTKRLYSRFERPVEQRFGTSEVGFSSRDFRQVSQCGGQLCGGIESFILADSGFKHLFRFSSWPISK